MRNSRRPRSAAQATAFPQLSTAARLAPRRLPGIRRRSAYPHTTLLFRTSTQRTASVGSRALTRSPSYTSICPPSSPPPRTARDAVEDGCGPLPPRARGLAQHSPPAHPTPAAARPPMQPPPSLLLPLLLLLLQHLLHPSAILLLLPPHRPSRLHPRPARHLPPPPPRPLSLRRRDEDARRHWLPLPRRAHRRHRPLRHPLPLPPDPPPSGRDRSPPLLHRHDERQPPLPLLHRPRLLRHAHTPRHPAQPHREPCVVHAVHAVPGGDRAGPAGDAAQLPDHGQRPHRPARVQLLPAGRGHGGSGGHEHVLQRE